MANYTIRLDLKKIHGIHIFRFNQKITQKLNGEKPLKIRRK